MISIKQYLIRPAFRYQWSWTHRECNAMSELSRRLVTKQRGMFEAGFMMDQIIRAYEKHNQQAS